MAYGWRNGAKFTKFIFIHIQCCYCYSRIYLLPFSNRVCVQKIYLFAFNGVFLFRDYVYSHLGHVFIHIQRVIFVHIHDSKYSFSIFCAASLRIIRSQLSLYNFQSRHLNFVFVFSFFVHCFPFFNQSLFIYYSD